MQVSDYVPAPSKSKPPAPPKTDRFRRERRVRSRLRLFFARLSRGAVATALPAATVARTGPSLSRP